MPTCTDTCERRGCPWQREATSRYCRDHDREQRQWQREFDKFMMEVNAALAFRVGGESSDLPDFDYAAYFDAGTEPADVACMLLEDGEA